MTGKTALTITLEPELAALLNDLAAIPPWERIYAGGRIIEQLKSSMPAVGDLRRAAVRELRDEGLTYGEIADVAGVTPARIHSILFPSGVRRAAATRRAADQGSP